MKLPINGMPLTNALPTTVNEVLTSFPRSRNVSLSLPAPNSIVALRAALRNEYDIGANSTRMRLGSWGSCFTTKLSLSSVPVILTSSSFNWIKLMEDNTTSLPVPPL